MALHYSNQKMSKPDKIIKGKTADAIYTKIVRIGFGAAAAHLAYLGSELAKAEIALRTGKEYIQERSNVHKIATKRRLNPKKTIVLHLILAIKEALSF